MLKQRLEWKIKRFRRQLEQQIESFKNLWRGTQVSTRMCPNCRALVAVGEKRCVFCGEKLRRRPSGLGKLLQNVLPHYAPVSYSLLTVNFLFFLLIFYTDRDSSAQDLQRLLGGSNSSALAAWGADVAWLVQRGQWWRLISAIFIHIGIIHLAFNSYALIFIGPLLEELLGKERFLVLYLTTGAFGFLLSNWYYPPILTTAGASGAIFGMIGVAIVLSKRWSTWGSVLHQQLVHWAIYGFVYGLLLGANNAAHLGGFVAGVALAFTLGNPNRAETVVSQQRLWTILFWGSVVITLGALALALQFRFRSIS
jgi:membrane associated rhomboid family serine protease